MEKKINEYLRQLNWRIDSLKQQLQDAQKRLNDSVTAGRYDYIDTRDVEKIKVFERALEELDYQRTAFIGTFEIEEG